MHWFWGVVYVWFGFVVIIVLCGWVGLVYDFGLIMFLLCCFLGCSGLVWFGIAGLG